MFHTVYQITNKINGKIYVGKHSTFDLKDLYMGSSPALNKAIEKYGKENFTKEILAIFDDENSAYLHEASIVTLEFMKRKDTYNFKQGGRGAKSGEAHPMYDRKGEKNPMFGRKHSAETIAKLKKPKTAEHCRKLSEGQKGEKHFFYGKKRPEHAEKMKEKMKGKNNPMFGKPGTMLGKKHTPEAKAKLKTIQEKKRIERQLSYYSSPKECLYCKKVLPFEKKHNKCCDHVCGGKFTRSIR